MSVWIDPVFDRTQADVEFAIQKISEWVLADITGVPRVVYDFKGCLNVSDINRIEGNIAYLAKQLDSCYYTPDTNTQSWTRTGMPNQKDVSRILYNVRALITAFHQQKRAPSVPTNLIDYKDVNAIEENLFLIKELLDAMVASFKPSGTFHSGSTTYLPIRR